MSLKSISLRQTPPGRFPLFDLPEELLRYVVDQLCAVDDLLSVSLVSKRLRDAALPTLYGSINLTLTTAVQKNGETFLDFLLGKPNLHEYIQEVIIRDPPPTTDRPRGTEGWAYYCNLCTELKRQRQQELAKFARLSILLPKLGNVRY